MGPVLPDNVALKRKRPDGKSPTPKLPDNERRLYDVIRNKEDEGIWTGDMKVVVKLPESVFTKTLKSLQAKNLIKEVVNVKNKKKKYFMAMEFEPSKALTGGAWYVDGEFDAEFIKGLKDLCKTIIRNKKIATVESIYEAISKSGCMQVECSTGQISEILQCLVLDNEIMESTNMRGAVCYKYIKKMGPAKGGAMALIPCGVCPRITECSPDGIISPTTCVYYKKWLDF